MVDRAALASGFLHRAGWAAAHRTALPHDASARSYTRLTLADQTAILMDAPPGQADDPADFVRLARFLAGAGLSTPEILAEDLGDGFLLLEDFGDAVFARLLDADPAQERALYTAATDVLIHLARVALPQDLPMLTAHDWTDAACLVLSDYADPLGAQVDQAAFYTALKVALLTHADGPRIFIHRDYHAENLILLPDRTGLRRVGILDFQLGQGGQPGYDLVSILQDARRDVSPATEAAMTLRYAGALGLPADTFAARYATLGAQRALRILGIFARQARVLGKPRYLPMMPRVWAQLQANLAHPALQGLRRACAALPEPSPQTLQRLVAP